MLSEAFGKSMHWCFLQLAGKKRTEAMRLFGEVDDAAYRDGIKAAELFRTAQREGRIPSSPVTLDNAAPSPHIGYMNKRTNEQEESR